LVTTTRSDAGDGCSYVLRPNHSLSWKAAKLCFATIAGGVLTVALTFTLMGLWPILPFAGLELAVLGYCFYRCAVNAQICEVITVGTQNVKVEKGRHRPADRWDLPRAWATVTVKRHPIRGYPSWLYLRTHGRGVELGSFLNEEERRDLAADLSRTLRRAAA